MDFHLGKKDLCIGGLKWLDISRMENMTRKFMQVMKL